MLLQYFSFEIKTPKVNVMLWVREYKEQIKKTAEMARPGDKLKRGVKKREQ